MGFEVIENPLRTIWVPVNFANTSDTLYEGQIVGTSLSSSLPAGEGMLPIGAAAGAVDTTGKAVPFGVVVGDNNATKTFDSTYKCHSIASVGSQADLAARDVRGVEGMHPKGDKAAYVKVAVIGTDTILKGRLFNGAYGTAITAYSNTTASTTGGTVTTSAVSFTPIAYNTTWYNRSGANRGIYRIAYSTSTTSHTFYIAFPNDIAVGDVFVPAAIRQGTCAVQFDAESTYIEMSSVAYSTNYYLIDVLEVNLEKSGEEYVIFKFNADQFCAARA